MDFDEALQVLGIDATATPKQARRAYLKLIKVHKPDRDPEMFRRVREAYEAVKDPLTWRQMTDDWHAADAGSEPDAPEPDAPEPDAAEPDAAEPNAPPPDAPIYPFHDAPVGLDDSAPAEPPVPVVVPAESPAMLMHEAFELIHADVDVPKGARTALRAFELAQQDFALNPPSSYDALHVCLLLYVRRQPRHARAVSAAFVQWVDNTGAARDLMGGWAGGRLAVLQALLALPEGLHSAPLGIIAAGMLDDDVDINRALRGFAQDKPYAAMETREAFERHAPMLAQAWAEPLREQAAARAPRSSAPAAPPAGSGFDNSDDIMLILGRFGMLIALLLFGWVQCDDRPSRRKPRDIAAAAEVVKRLRQPALDPPVSTAPSSAAAAPATAAPLDPAVHPAWLIDFCPLVSASKCDRAKGIWSAFDAGRCAVAKRRYAWLSSDMMLAPKARTALKRGGVTIKKQCAARSP